MRHTTCNVRMYVMYYVMYMYVCMSHVVCIYTYTYMTYMKLHIHHTCIYFMYKYVVYTHVIFDSSTSTTPLFFSEAADRSMPTLPCSPNPVGFESSRLLLSFAQR